MNKLMALLLFTGICTAQKISVTEQQLRINPSAAEEFFYSFAAGDKILLTVEEMSGNAIGEVTVLEYPDTYKYKGYDVKKEKNREFIVNNRSVYKFRFNNTSKDARVCNVKIQRIPASKQTENFNTAVKWVIKQDTTWNSLTKDVVVGYDTLSVQKTRKAVTSEKKYEEVVIDKSQRVDSKATLGQNKASVVFTLPMNYLAKDETKKVIAWAYWVGVGEESNEFWKQNRKIIVGAVQGATTMFTSPLGGIAAGAITNLVLPTNGEDVEYALVNEQNNKLFFQDKTYKTLDAGKGVAAYKRFIDANMLQGKFYMALTNDNYVQPIDVNVKISAIIEHIKYKDEKYMDKVITPRYEKKIVKEPKIVSSTIPVPFDQKM